MINDMKKAGKLSAVFLAAFFLADLLSFFSLSSPLLNVVIFFGLFLAVLLLSFWRLEYGLLFVLGELFAGSMGHLFVFEVGGFSLPIRMALWGALLLSFSIRLLFQLLAKGKESEYLRALLAFSFKKQFILLFAFIIIGVLSAIFRGRELSLLFADANAWLYILLLFPAIVVYRPAASGPRRRLYLLFISAAVWLSLKTLFLLAVFKHDLSFAPATYSWLRDTLTGEMTNTLSGWPRVFLQGQVFAAIAFFLTLFERLRLSGNDLWPRLGRFLLASLFASAILMSFSRSFWVGLAVAGVFAAFLVIRRYSFKRALFLGGFGVAAFVFGYLLIYAIATISFSGPGEEFNADFLGRVSNQNEAAVSSRWSLLPVLGREALKSPLIGQGYGATVTYYSQDPRVLERDPSGRYTTYAFEWGYLDIALKLGLLGLAAYLFLLFSLVSAGLKQHSDNLGLFLATAVVFLAATHFFTPFLNHPLGLGIVVLGACLLAKDGVY